MTPPGTVKQFPVAKPREEGPAGGKEPRFTAGRRAVLKHRCIPEASLPPSAKINYTESYTPAHCLVGCPPCPMGHTQ